MINITRLSSIVCAAFLFLISNPSKAQLSYQIDSTHGLDVVSWEDGGEVDIEFSDINDDGDVDMVSIGGHGSPGVNTNSHGIMVWFGNGTGANWTHAQNGTFGYGGLAVGDVNNDGFKDVGYAMHHNWGQTDLGNQFQEVSLGDGTGLNWTPWDDSLGQNGEQWGMSGTDFGDINNDGLLDIGSISMGCCDGIHIHKNLGTGVWPQSFSVDSGNSKGRFLFGDLNNDGNLDFIVTHQKGSCYFGDGFGNFTRNDSGIAIPLYQGFWEIDVADIDNDGTLEVGALVAGTISLYKLNTTTNVWQNISSMFPAGNYYNLIMKDFNQDGFVDICTFGHENMTLYRGDGGHTWLTECTNTITRLEHVFECNAADVDHSGTLDVVMMGRHPISLVNDATKLYFFKENTVPSSLGISPVYPKGHECLPNNGVRFIEWNTTVPSSMNSKIMLEFSSTGLAGPWTLIGSGLPDNGKYQWTVPSLVISDNCFIRYTVTDSITGQTAVATSPSSFTIACSLINSAGTLYAGKNISVYPNPFSDKTIVSGNGFINNNVSYSLLDAQGRIVRHVENVNAGNFVINRNDLDAGIYFLQIKEEGRNDLVKKLIIQ